MKKEKKLKKRVVVIGGGSGTFNVLNSFKRHYTDLSAIIAVTDNGGSSGILRKEFNIQQPGDPRRALLALADVDKDFLKLFDYRFKEGRGLSGHSFGNLMITALERITGNFDKAIIAAGKILNTKGDVIPVSLTRANLVAKLENGKKIFGETNIDIPKHDGRLKIIDLSIKPKAKLNPRAKNKIARADLIVVGPGDLYTSILPNIIVEGMVHALKKSRAKIVFVVNVMTKFGETNGFCAQNFIDEAEKYAGKGLFDYFIVNSKKPSRETLLKYAKEKASFVQPIFNKEDARNILVADLIKDKDYIRHDSDKLAKLITEQVFKL